MNEPEWQRLEERLVEAHRAAEPQVPPALWRGVEAALAARVPRRGSWPAMAMVVLVAACLVLWFLPATPRGPGGVVAPRTPPTERVRDAGLRTPPPPPPPPARATVPSLSIVLPTTAAVTFAMSVDAGRVELEPCVDRFINVTLLDGPHHDIALHEVDHRVEVELDGGHVMQGGVAHILVPTDTHLVLSTRNGAVVVRGLGGRMEIDTVTGDVTLDTAARLDPSVTVTTDSGAIAWRGRCGTGCRVAATSRTGDITLRASDRTAFTSGAVHGESRTGRVRLEELTCRDPLCSSSPLPWRQ